MGFCLYRRSYLLWPSVVVVIVAAVAVAVAQEVAVAVYGGELFFSSAVVIFMVEICSKLHGSLHQAQDRTYPYVIDEESDTLHMLRNITLDYNPLGFGVHHLRSGTEGECT